MLPVIAARASSAVGCGFASSSAFALISWPEVQKPHCGASWSMKACCSGSFRRPSTVCTARPSAQTAR
jgi:hypothetical protein